MLNSAVWQSDSFHAPKYILIDLFFSNDKATMPSSHWILTISNSTVSPNTQPIFKNNNGSLSDFPGGTVDRVCLPMQEHEFAPWSGKIHLACEQLNAPAPTTKAALSWGLRVTATEACALGRAHEHSYWASVLQLLMPVCPSLCSATRGLTTVRGPCATARQEPRLCNHGKPCTSMKAQHSQIPVSF